MKVKTLYSIKVLENLYKVNTAAIVIAFFLSLFVIKNWILIFVWVINAILYLIFIALCIYIIVSGSVCGSYEVLKEIIINTAIKMYKVYLSEKKTYLCKKDEEL